MKRLEEKGLIILVRDEKEENTYHVEEGVRGGEESQGWPEGTVFHPLGNRGKLESVDEHYFVIESRTNGNGEESQRIVGVAHTEAELREKTYDCAVKYCEMIARQRERGFVDQTNFHVPLSPKIPEHPEDYENKEENREGYIQDPGN